MVTIIIVLNLIGGFVFYNLSQKTKTLEKVLFFNWLHQKETLSKATGGVLLSTGLLLSVLFFGFVSGLLFWFLLLSAVLCLIIVLIPLKVINNLWLGVLLVLCLIVEILVK